MFDGDGCVEKKRDVRIISGDDKAWIGRMIIVALARVCNE